MKFLLGAAVDRSNGSAFDYPTFINVPVSKQGTFTVIDLSPEQESTSVRERKGTRR